MAAQKKIGSAIAILTLLLNLGDARKSQGEITQTFCGGSRIGSSLIKLTTKFAVLDVKLEEEMTRRQRHFVDFRRIPRAHYQAPALRICFDLRDQIIDLVHSRAVRATPVAPLRTIDATEIASFVSPLVPDAHTMFVEITNIRFAAQKPKQFVNDRFDVQLFCCEQRESGSARAQIKSGLCSEDR